jgi:hypothetical protein
MEMDKQNLMAAASPAPSAQSRARAALALISAALLAAGATAFPLVPSAAGRTGSSVPAGARFGGGSDPSRTQNVIALVAFATARSGRSLNLWVEATDFKCGAPDGQALFVVRGVKIASSGAFRTAGTFSNAVPGTGPGRYRLSGRFVRRDLAAGSVHLNVGSCEMGALAWKAANPAAGLGSGVKHAGGTYAGYTSQWSTRADVQLPFVVRLSANGHVVAGVTTSVNVSGTSALCTGSDWQLWFGRPFAKSFSDTEDLQEPGPGQGELGTWHFVVGGRFGGRKVTGTWRETGTITRQSDNRVLARCSSGGVTWQAVSVG